MIYRRFGRTGLQLSVFSCGGMRAQQSWSRTASVTDASQQNLAAVVARARALGINHFETARGYGTSEAQFGRALASHPRAASSCRRSCGRMKIHASSSSSWRSRSRCWASR